MNAETLFQAVQAVAVVAGVGFAVYETRRYRSERNREAAMELLHAFQTPEFREGSRARLSIARWFVEAAIERAFARISTSCMR